MKTIYVKLCHNSSYYINLINRPLRQGYWNYQIKNTFPCNTFWVVAYYFRDANENEMWT